MRDAKTTIENQDKQRRALGSLLASDLGRQLLEELDKEFDGDDIMDPDPYRTAFNLGARSVVRMMKALRTLAQKE